MARPAMFSTRIDLPGEAREKIIRVLNQHLAGTADLFTEISRALDKALWFLESHIQE